MDIIANELIDVLNKETQVYDDILKISRNKTNIIIEGRVAELETIVKLEQSLVLQLGRFETMREGLVDKLSSQLNIKPSEITISEMVGHLHGGQANKLKACQDGMVNTLNELKGTNELNSKLIKNSLDFINFSINLLAQVDMGANNYGNTGMVRDSRKRNLFDIKL